MDSRRFDALTRVLSRTGSRRRTLSAFLGSHLGALALGGLALQEAESRNKKKKRTDRKVRAEGPCGNGSARKNRCKRDRQCCTNFCKKGRCRCRKLGQTCTEDRNCCPERTGRTCIDGTCQTQTCIGLTDPCSPDLPCCEGLSCQNDACMPELCVETCLDGCCAGQTCVTETSNAACGIGGADCQVCDEGQICTGGVCACGDVCAEGCPLSSLQAAIDAADPGDTIRLCAETYTGTITIDKDLTIQGRGESENGTVLDGLQQGAVITVNVGVTAALEGLRITGGKAEANWLGSGAGGGMLNAGGVVTLVDSTVTGNEAAQYGGGIFSVGGACTLDNCTTTYNTAGVFGGGIYSEMGRGDLSSGADTVDLIDCTVANNTALGRLGGGIFTALGTTVTLDGTTVTLNVASDSGGGVFCDVNGVVNLTSSSVFGNTPDNCDGPSSATFNGPGCAP